MVVPRGDRVDVLTLERDAAERHGRLASVPVLLQLQEQPFARSHHPLRTPCNHAPHRDVGLLAPQHHRWSDLQRAVHLVAGQVVPGIAGVHELVGADRRHRIVTGSVADRSAVQGQRVHRDADAVRVAILVLHHVTVECPNAARTGKFRRSSLAPYLQRQLRRSGNRYRFAEVDPQLYGLIAPVGVAAAARPRVDEYPRRPRSGLVAATTVDLRRGQVGNGMVIQIQVSVIAGAVPDRAAVQSQRVRCDADTVRIAVLGLHHVLEERPRRL